MQVFGGGALEVRDTLCDARALPELVGHAAEVPILCGRNPSSEDF